MVYWQFSQQNYDMLSQNPCDTMRLHMNQLYTDSIVKRNQHFYPAYDYNNFFMYNNGNDYLTNPAYTLGQMAWGTPNWNNYVNAFGNGNNNCTNTFGWWGSNFGSNNSTSNSTSSTNNDPEQEEYKIKYNKLYNLVNQLRTHSGLLSSERAKLNAACKNTKGTWEERYDALKEAYDEVKKDAKEEIIQFLIESEKVRIGTNDDGKQDNKSATLNEALKNTGFEFKNTDTDEAVEVFHDSINGLKGNDGSAEDAASIIAEFNFEAINILDFISSWNSNYNDSKDSKRILEHIKKNVGRIKDKDIKETTYSQIVDPLIDSLVKESEKFGRRNLDSNSYTLMEQARKDLRDAQDKCKNEISDGLIKAFDTLYVLTRKAAMAQFRQEVIDSYGEVDSELFNDDIFVDELNEDLKEEGLENIGSDITVRRRRSEGRVSEDKESKDDKAGKTEDEKVEKRDEKETNVTEQNEAKANGKFVGEKLIGYTDSYVYTEVNNKLSELDEDNIVSFLDGYYVDAKRLGKVEGLIEKLDDEYDGGTITMDNKKNIVNSLLTVAEEVVPKAVRPSTFICERPSVLASRGRWSLRQTAEATSAFTS